MNWTKYRRDDGTIKLEVIYKDEGGRSEKVIRFFKRIEARQRVDSDALAAVVLALVEVTEEEDAREEIVEMDHIAEMCVHEGGY